MSIKYLSDCCGAEMDEIFRDVEICPDCKGHCCIDEEEVDDWTEQYGLQN